MAIELPKEFSLLGVVVIATYFFHMWLSTRVVAARQKYKVQYPAVYAVQGENKDAKVFNCVQRGHQNFLENVTFFLAMLVFAGLQHPRVASVIGLLWLAARAVYFIDYSSGDPERRFRGAGSGYLCMFVLIGCATSFSQALPAVAVRRAVIMAVQLSRLLYVKAPSSSGARFGSHCLLSSKSLLPTSATTLFCNSFSSVRNTACVLSVSKPLSPGVAAVAKEINSREEGKDEYEEKDVPQHEITPASAGGFQVLGSKEKKELRAYAHGLGTRLDVHQIGKLGVSQTVVNSLSDALEAKEILKVRVLENCASEMDDVVLQLEKGTGGQVVGKIGRTVLLYRASLRKLAVEKEPERSRRRGSAVPSRKQASRGPPSPRKSHRVQTPR